MPEEGQTLQLLSHKVQHVVGKQLVVRKDAPDLLSSHFSFSAILETGGFLNSCEPFSNSHQ